MEIFYQVISIIGILFDILTLSLHLQHDESIRRHMEQIEQRKEKAAELSSGRHANTDYAPKLTPYERKKQCSLCGVLVGCHCQNGEDIIHYQSLLSYENTLSLFFKTHTEASAEHHELLS